ncbi:hypothetical protein BV898_18133 [Hypsibius exemplaris]|uniref:PHD-type domain-containing protein n=1 Tax=Hypsibius exemplaris TaxID=2072580 RepID=A0A9X6NNI5_HYPEX|nr:hypothetical protein BV898_18133 [Hypsibius exemplaris]
MFAGWPNSPEYPTPFQNASVNRADDCGICKIGQEGFMIGCDKCRGWFHGSCMAMSADYADTIETFYCMDCLNMYSLKIVFKPLHPLASPAAHETCMRRTPSLSPTFSSPALTAPKAHSISPYMTNLTPPRPFPTFPAVHQAVEKLLTQTSQAAPRPHGRPPLQRQTPPSAPSRQLTKQRLDEQCDVALASLTQVLTVFKNISYELDPVNQSSVVSSTGVPDMTESLPEPEAVIQPDSTMSEELSIPSCSSASSLGSPPQGTKTESAYPRVKRPLGNITATIDIID